MKKIILFAVLGLFFQAATPAESQVLKKIVKKVKDKSNQRLDEKIDKNIERSLNKSESVFKHQKGDTIPTEKKVEQKQKSKENSQQAPVLKWSKYDFVPGEIILFEDNLKDEENGEFPSRWDLVEGRVENVVFDGVNCIRFFKAASKIVPYIKNRDKDYLPESFTIEFDVWFDKNEYTEYPIWFWDVKNQEALDLKPLIISANAVRLNQFKDFYPTKDYEWNLKKSFWRHVAIAFNKRSLKVYLDESRIINVPNIEVNPTGLTIGCDGFSTAGVKGLNRIITHIKVAKGGPKLYDKFLTDGKIVATGIKFETNKATLKPESMGIVNKIYKIMKGHPDLKFSVEGHTDTVGDEDFNMSLSLQRAETVRGKLVSMGIDAARLNVKGLGESMPIASNETPEGRANNRRVEFVKM